MHAGGLRKFELFATIRRNPQHTNTRAIEKTHMHTLTPSQLQELASSDAAARLSVAARERLGWIRFFVEHSHSVSETCVHLGISRSTFHRWLERFDPNDLTSLEEKSHEPHTQRSALVPENIITLIRAYRQSHPHMGKEQIRTLLLQEHNVTVSASTVGRVIERECLYFAATPLHWKKRMHQEERQTVAVAPVQTQVYTTPTQTNTEPTSQLHDTSHDGCAFCMVKHMGWSAWKRVLMVTSMLVNVAIAISFFATVHWESQKTTAQVSSHIPQTTETISSLDRP